MRQLSHLSSFAGCAFLVSLALVSGCSSSDSPPPAPAPDGDGDGVDVPIDGPPPGAALINATTARTIATESLELADSLVYIFSNASGQLLDNDPATVCGTSGSVAVTALPTSQTFVLSDCELGAVPELRANGQIVFEGAFDNGFTGAQTFTGFQVASGSRTVSIDGAADVVSAPGNVAISGAELVLNDSQSEVTLSQSTLSIAGPGSAQQSVQLNLNMDSPRFGLVGAQAVSTGLNGPSVGCPQSGSLTVSAEGDGTLVINGAVGENLTFDIDGESDTLACSEVTTTVAAPTGPPELVLTPPAVPGGI